MKTHIMMAFCRLIAVYFPLVSSSFAKTYYVGACKVPFQCVLEAEHFADCVRNNKQPESPGEEGPKDMLSIEAIYKAAGATRAIAVMFEVHRAIYYMSGLPCRRVENL